MPLVTKFIDGSLLGGPSYHRKPKSAGAQSNTDPEVQRIIQIAAILRRKLPGDIVPMILEHAERWHTFRQSEATTLFKADFVFESSGPILCGRLVIPSYVLQGSIRSVRFEITNQGLKDTSDPSSSTPGAAWFEAGVSGLDGEGRDKKKKKKKDIAVPKRIQYVWPPQLLEYKYGSKKICQNEENVECTLCDTDVTEHKTEWTANDNDQNIRKIMKELQGGSTIEVVAFAKHPWINSVSDVNIEVKWAPVTKM